MIVKGNDLSLYAEMPRDFATEDRQRMISNWQPNWMAILGMVICSLSIVGVIALIVHFIKAAHHG